MRCNRTSHWSILIILLTGTQAYAQTQDTTSPAVKKNYYAVQYTTGTAWDSAKQPNEQAFFKEHSQLLSKLRTSGTIVIGARYSDKGLLVVQAASEEEARTHFADDPSVLNSVFRFEVFRLGVFYGGCVGK
ncbi:MAG: hypothetical protein KF749_06825 [Bacteroidetes bacterium]|nr:hypothetical protein [Bacteroidota bacterium]MCW5896947.1 hypothetical protein [Bacteroidota bacterium]